jgi:hypothetical protein
MTTSASSIALFAGIDSENDDSEVQNSILVGEYDFFGPYITSEGILSQPGLLALLIEEEQGFELLDLMTSSDMRRTSETELDFYSENLANIAIAVFYAAGCESEELEAIKEKILHDFDSLEEDN